MKKLKVLAILCLIAMPAFSAPVALNTWYSFGWVGGVGAHAFGGIADYLGSSGTTVVSTGAGCVPLSAITCTFSTAGATTLTVRDLFFDGDQFQVFDNGVSLGFTSSVASTSTDCGDDPIACTANSSGIFNLAAGSHSLDIVLVQQATGISSGRGAFLLGAAAGVPEPATMGLIGLGLLGIAFRTRRRRT